MIRGRKPIPRGQGCNPTSGEPVPPKALPRCPDHLCDAARREWRRLARPLFDMGVLAAVDRGALAAYCQAWARWVEAERQMAETPLLIRTPSGYVQQSPWLSIANKQLEIMNRYLAELGITPAARRRVAVRPGASGEDVVPRITVVTRYIVRPGDDAQDSETTQHDCEDAEEVCYLGQTATDRGDC